MKRFRGGLVFKAHRWLYHSTLGSRVIKKQKKRRSSQGAYQPFRDGVGVNALLPLGKRDDRPQPAPLQLEPSMVNVDRYDRLSPTAPLDHSENS